MQSGAAILVNVLILPFAVALPLAMVALPILAARRWRGAWRYLALLSLAPLAVCVARIVVDTARDPTSHNLFPLEILMWGGSGLLFVAFLWLLRIVLAVR